MKRYDILPHTADGKFRAFGRTLEEAFANAALALASLMWDWSKIEPTITRPVRLNGRDRKQLLVKFLGEIIFLFETQKFLLAAVDGLEIRDVPDGFCLEAELLGDTLSDRYELYGDVKAVTYNEMKIEECGGVVLQVVVDM
ncbi:MAG: archease [Acidobacteriota bacterium]